MDPVEVRRENFRPLTNSPPEPAQNTYIEGLATNGSLHPMQQGFSEQHGLQRLRKS